MKKKILVIFTAMIIFGLSIAVYAYTNQSNHHDSKTSCCAMKDCCKDGECKMNHECCKSHDSCPMKSKENSGEIKDCPMHKSKSQN